MKAELSEQFSARLVNSDTQGHNPKITGTFCNVSLLMLMLLT